MKKVDDQHCNRPDRDAPGTVCGYPLPCPWYTVVIDVGAGTVTSPPNAPLNHTLKAMRIRDALVDSEVNR